MMVDESKKKKKKLKSEFYDTSGELKRTAKFCPKCGAGVFLAEHNDRFTCGNCGYTEMKGGTKEEKEAPKEDTTKEEEKPVEAVEEKPTEEAKEEQEEKKE